MTNTTEDCAIKPNRLIHESSPYLLQHAHNPVDWYPWGEESLLKARQEDKPILLSIGYSACHWCHVMAHESFEDEQTATVMNALFVNIKVDREERPDLDKIYQLSHQVLTQRGGGWPLTVVLEPQQHIPFFAGTYFPKQTKHGMPPFTSVLQRVEKYYRQRKKEITEQNKSLMHVLETINKNVVDEKLQFNSQPLDKSCQQLAESYDEKYTGFGAAPKFPHPTHLERLLRHWSATAVNGHADKQALDMALNTLRAIAAGGMNDQLDGGFFRYSVDDKWMIPHFEKMLYDNGPLLSLYSYASKITDEPLFNETLENTANWLMNAMQSSEGGYYSTIDADSEGEEGKYYVWNKQQMAALLTGDQYSLIELMFGLNRDPNFEGEWHLHTYNSIEQAATKLGIELPVAQQILKNAKLALLQHRSKRVAPGRDEKILTSWNALAIKAMAQAYMMNNNEQWITSAIKAMEFIRSTLWVNQRLLATYKDGKARLNAYLDDYAFLLDAIVTLLQARWNSAHCQFAITLADTLISHYEDKKLGGFYFTSDDHETLIQRMKTLSDEAIPSGNGIAAHSFLRLGHLLGNTQYIDTAQRTLKTAWQAINQSPSAYNALLLSLEETLFPTQVIVLRGAGDELVKWKRRAQQFYCPRRMCFAIENSEEDLPDSIALRKPKGNIAAYICQAQLCTAPITSFDEFCVQLESLEARI